MPYVDDPYALARQPELISDESLFREPRDYHEFFWDDQQMQETRYAESDMGIHTDICVFRDGHHVYMADGCPHFEPEDEQGRIIRQGWTVQSGT